MEGNPGKVKKPYVSRFSRLDNSEEPFEPERYEELMDEGFSDSYIASELNVNEEFLSHMIKDMEKESNAE